MKCDLDSELEQKICEVKKDHAGGNDDSDISDRALKQDTDILNPDPETLDRG